MQISKEGICRLREPEIWRKPQAQLDPKPWVSYQGSQPLHLISLPFVSWLNSHLLLTGFLCEGKMVLSQPNAISTA